MAPSWYSHPVPPRAAIFLMQVALVIASVVIGAWVAEAFRVIPAWLLPLPNVTYSTADIRTVTLAFGLASAVTFFLSRVLLGWDVFRTPVRCAQELYALLVGVVAASLYLFLFTGVNFSPEFLVDASSIAALLLSMLLVAARRAARLADSTARDFGGLLLGVMQLLRRPWAWVIVLFALSPVLMAMLFLENRNFAAWVTDLRIWSNVSRDHKYVVVNALAATRFQSSIDASFANSDPGTIYVLERGGRLYRVDYPSGDRKTLLLDISSRLGYVEMENGALGFALHPSFGRGGEADGYVYVYYTEHRQDRQTNRLDRFDLRIATAAGRDAARVSLIAQHRNGGGYHNGGSVQFGPDGFLYLAVGEAQMPDCFQRIDCALVGGIFRIDVDQRGGAISRPITRQPKDGETAGYYIPLDNPYASRPDVLGEFYAHGLRNPFRIGFDVATGDLWVGDVGSTVWEEINRIVAGGNYQFPYIEGEEPYLMSLRPADPVGRDVGPVLTYRHTAFLRSVIGGFVYRGKKVSDARDRYVFMDGYSGEIMIIPVADRVDSWEVLATAPDVAQRGGTALLAAPDDELLVITMGANNRPTGMVGKLVPASGAALVSQQRESSAVDRSADGPVTRAHARSVYNVSCARCHGETGQGNGPDADLLGVPLPDFTDHHFHSTRTDAHILRSIEGGGTAVGRSPAMPPWNSVLSGAEIEAVKDVVREFGHAGSSRGGHVDAGPTGRVSRQ